MYNIFFLEFYDHGPLLVATSAESRVGGRPFRLFNCLADPEDFHSLVVEEWGIGGCSYGFASICKKLSCIKARLKLLHVQEFKGTRRRLEEWTLRL